MHSHIDEKHAHHTEQQAADAGYLHAAGQIKTFAQIADLCGCHVRMLLHILFLEGTYQLGVRQETVGIGQHNQRDGREK